MGRFFELILLLCSIVVVSSFVSLPLTKSTLPADHPFRTLGVRSRSSPLLTQSNESISGNILPQGIYWLEVEIGTPAKSFQLALDTGSQNLLIPETGCVGCHSQFTGAYTPNASSTSMPVPCDTKDFICKCAKDNLTCNYLDVYLTCNLTAPDQRCTAEGALYKDVFSLGGLQAETVFGTIQHQSENFQQFFFIDGVMGFVPELDSDFGGVSSFQRLVDAGLVSNQFAICLNAHTGGVITLGGVDPSLYLGNFQYSPLHLDRGYFTPIVSLSVVGQAPITPEFSDKQFCIDSGTNTLLLPTPLYDPLIEQLYQVLCSSPTPPKGVCQGENGLFNGTCYTFTETQLSLFPNITLELEGVSLNVSPQQYLITNSEVSQEYCFGIQNSGKGGYAILGDVVMQSYYTLFDVVNRKLGWAAVNPATC